MSTLELFTVAATKAGYVLLAAVGTRFRIENVHICMLC